MTGVHRLGGAVEPPPDGLGGKGEGLARLAAAGGFDVPAGFVIPARLAAALATGGASAEQCDAVLAGVAETASEGGLLAVRSSALDEDGEDASFAGQHLTRLDVAPPDVLEAVREVVASLDSEEAAAYRSEHGSRPAAGMAVVVQRMVAARAAGVAFTLDPATGDRSRVVVEAVRGQGEALVSGRVRADRWVFERDGLAPIEAGGSVLGMDDARTVAGLALEAEALFGSPQDIEFAFEGDRAWLLQSRPVTAVGTRDRTGEFDTDTPPETTWTSANIGEVLPGLLTPLTMTVFQHWAAAAYTEGYRRMGLLTGDESPQFVGMFHHRAFLNVDATRLIAERAIGTDGDAIEHRFLGSERGVRGRREPLLRRLRFKATSLVPVLRMAFTIERQGERVERDMLALEARVRAEDPASLSDAELEARRDELARASVETFRVHLQASGAAGAGFETVTRAVKAVLGDDTEGTVPVLFSGMRGVESAQIGLDLWRLAGVARESGLEAALGEPGFDPRASDLPARWREAFEAFLARHGHRGVHEMEPAEPCWRDDPGPVTAIVVSYLALPDAQSPPAVLDRQERERERVTTDLRARMNPIRRRAFDFTLRYAQRWVALRERTKSAVVRGTRLSDHYAPEIAHRLTVAGHLAEASDLFFLTDAEVTAALTGRAEDSYLSAVRRRRKAYERDRYVRLPERFTGRPEPLTAEAHLTAGATLQGTPVSPGIVTGRARVVLDPRTDGPLRPGEILVAPVTDAGWTPLFALAAGLVVDMGSALSHGSTVAREFGLPAVVNVRGATGRIRTGDLVSIDGSRGVVTLLEE